MAYLLSLPRTSKGCRILGLWIVLNLGASKILFASEPPALQFAGRLGEADHGDRTLTFDFYPTADSMVVLTKSFQTTVNVSEGYFTVDLSQVILRAEIQQNLASCYIEVTDDTGRKYPRQRVLSVPLALKVPVDQKTLKFNSSGNLEVDSIDLDKIIGLRTTLDAKPNTTDLSTTLGLGSLATKSKITAGDVSDGSIANNHIAASANIVDTKLAAITTAGKVSGNAIVSGTLSGSTAIDTTGSISSSGGIKLNALSSAPTELRFHGANNANYVALKAANTIAANKVWTLPGVDGTNNQVLRTDGAGTLSWLTVTGSGGGDLFAANNLSDVANVTTARTNLGLGSLATASTIVNADVNAAAAIADTKLATISTAGKVSGSAITSGTIGGSTVVATSGQLSSTGNIRVAGTGVTATDLRFGDNDDSNYVGFKSPGVVGTNLIWTLPATDGTANQALSTNASGVLQWVTPLLASNNLSDLGNAGTARTNLGLGSLATGSAVTSAMITDDTIVDADINASAAIADTKLATISTAGKVSGSAITSGTIAGSTIFNTTGAVTTSAAVTGQGMIVNSTGAAATELRFNDDNNSNYVGFKSPSTVGTNRIWTLPDAEGTGGFVLSTDGSGALSWVTNSPTVALGSGVSGTLPVGNGGTGITTGTSGGVPYFSAASTIASSAALTSNGVVLGGGAGAAPTSTGAGAAYQPLRVPSGGGAPVFGALDLSQSAAVANALTVANGGTGLTTGTSGGLPYFSAPGTMGSSAALTVKGIVLGGGAGATPYTTAALTDGQLLIGSTAGNPTPATLTAGANAGVTITNASGSVTLDTTQDIRTSATPTFNGVNITTSLIAPTHVAGSSDNTASPVGGTVRASSGTGANVAGPNLTINAGNGTGTGGSGSIILQTAAAAGSSSTANNYKDWFRLTNTGSFIFGSGEGTATASAATIRGPAAAGANIAGTSLTVVAGNGTGTGGSGNILFRTAPIAGSSSTANTLATVMAITSAGNVGVGTTAPGSILDINGATTLRGMTAPSVSSAGQGILYFDSGANNFKISENTGAYVNLLSGNVALASQVSGTLPVGNGGTGITTGTSGGVPYFSAASTIASSGALTSNGVVLGGGAGAAPTSTAAGAAYQPLRIPSGGGAPVFGALDLTQSAAVTGALTVANGGTGLSSGTSGGIPYFSAAGTMASSAALTAKGIMIGGGAGTTPFTSSAMSTDGQLLIGNSAGNPAVATLTAGANAGVTIANGNGTITLSTTQDIRTTATPTFTGINGTTFMAGTGDAGSSPSGGTIRAATGAGTNIAGSDLTITAGNGTGTGGSGSLLFQTASVAGSSSTPNVLATRLAIIANGNVGIGTTAPGVELEVAGTIISTPATALTPSGTTQTIDFATSNMQTLNLGSATGTVTLTLNNGVNGGHYMIVIAQGVTPRTVVWPAAVKWEGGTPVVLSNSNSTDVITMIYNGTNYYAVASKDFM